jgi:hypothetical protein
MIAWGITASVNTNAHQDDPVMNAFCAVHPILIEDAFFEDRVMFNWLGGTGEPIRQLPVRIAGYEPGPDAVVEEMALDEISDGVFANVALGRGRAWTVPNGDYVAGIPTSLLPALRNHERELLVFDLRGEADCELQDWLLPHVQSAGGPLSVRSNEDYIPRQIREELELGAVEAAAVLERNRAAGRCIGVRWVDREALQLRAYRVYETRREGLYSYALSPHVITRGDEVVYFSMGVVRASVVGDAIPASVPDPFERTCCVNPLQVGACSRFGGPDPYAIDLRGRRAVWRPPSRSGG